MRDKTKIENNYFNLLSNTPQGIFVSMSTQSLYFKMITSSKNNVFYLLNKDVIDKIDEDVIAFENEKAQIIQKYYRKYVKNFIICANDYVGSVILDELYPSQSFFKNIIRFDKLFIDKKLNAEKIFKTVVKCDCCDYHKNKNKNLVFKKNTVLSPLIFLSTCKCNCSNTAIMCTSCEDGENNDLDKRWKTPPSCFPVFR